MAVSLNQYVERLTQCGLLTSEEVQARLDSVPENSRPRSAEELSRWLVRHGLLTAFQASAVLQGKTKGLVLGNYIILHRLGSGGMGQVFKAQHRRMKRVVAIKVLPTTVAKKPELIQRFSREVEAAAKLMHPNIVAAFDADESDGLHFLVMEYVPGRDLAALVKEKGPLAVTLCLHCLIDAARALEYAHAHGIVHRDIKPSNLLLTQAERSHLAADDPAARYTVKLLDLGLARIDEEAAAETRPSDLTGTGLVMGTVDYMSPEQAINTHTVDHRSDIYSLGMTMYFLLAGRPAYAGQSVMQRLIGHRESPIPSLVDARSDVPRQLDVIFGRMVAKHPDDRYQSVSEVARDLQALLEGHHECATLVDAAPPDDAALAEFLRSMSSAPRTSPAPSSATTPQLQLEAIARLADFDSSSTVLASAEGSTAETPVMSPNHRRASRRAAGDRLMLHGAWVSALVMVGAFWFLAPHKPPQPSPAPAPTETPQRPESPATPSERVPTPERQVATWVLRKGGLVTIADGGARLQQLQSGQSLPEWPFLVTQIELGGQLTRSFDDRERMHQLHELPQLQHLGLSSSPLVTHEWLTSLETYPDLSSLILVNTEISDDALQHIVRACPELVTLSLDSTAIVGSGLAHLSSLRRLQRLTLSHTNVEDRFVAGLSSLAGLTHLDVRQTPLSNESVTRLREWLPNCEILSDHPESE